MDTDATEKARLLENLKNELVGMLFSNLSFDRIKGIKSLTKVHSKCHFQAERGGKPGQPSGVIYASSLLLSSCMTPFHWARPPSFWTPLWAGLLGWWRDPCTAIRWGGGPARGRVAETACVCFCRSHEYSPWKSRLILWPRKMIFFQANFSLQKSTFLLPIVSIFSDFSFCIRDVVVGLLRSGGQLEDNCNVWIGGPEICCGYHAVKSYILIHSGTVKRLSLWGTRPRQAWVPSQRRVRKTQPPCNLPTVLP